jgi:(p)ppGpp synthase/HD superfamily hydrolase
MLYQPNWSPECYLKAWDFACLAHRGQSYIGHVPGVIYDYINHPAAVAMEVMYALGAHPPYDGNLALQCALLHDTLEDTEVSYSDLSLLFNKAVADGVQALTKNTQLPKAKQMRDSLQRIRQQPYEVWLVKLADRINNLQYAPPHWSAAKVRVYKDEAKLILDSLGTASPVLSQRLAERIQNYGQGLPVTPHQHLVNNRI